MRAKALQKYIAQNLPEFLFVLKMKTARRNRRAHKTHTQKYCVTTTHKPQNAQMKTTAVKAFVFKIGHHFLDHKRPYDQICDAVALCWLPTVRAPLEGIHNPSWPGRALLGSWLWRWHWIRNKASSECIANTKQPAQNKTESPLLIVRVCCSMLPL